MAALVIAVGINVVAAQELSSPDLGSLLQTRRLLQAGYEGQGVRIGVISDGTSNYRSLVEHNVLPSDVVFVGGDSSRGDEGDWMLQIVHQIAPRARLAFCPGGSAQETDDCARQLVTGFQADLVVDDTNPQPVFDFPSPKAIAFAELAQERPDVLFFTGAGNNGGGYYQGPWTPVPLVVNGTRYLAQDFGRSLGGASDPYETISLAAGPTATIMLGTSADPAPESGDCSAENPEVTLAVLDMRGRELASTTGRCPLQSLQYRAALRPFGPPAFAFTRPPSPFRRFPFPPQTQTLRIAMLVPADSKPGALTLKLVSILGGDGTSPIALSYRTGGSAGNSATTQHLIAVAAVDPYSGWHHRYLYEAFANSGPQCLNYGRNISGGWTRLPGPQCVQQPAFVVPDRVRVLVGTPNGSEYRPFQGDSAAGPAAAGVAALLLSARVPADRIISLLEQSAVPQVNAREWDAHYGYGLIDADAAAVAVGLLPAVQGSSSATWKDFQAVAFDPSPEFVRARNLSQQARQGDQQALTQLQAAAQAGDADAQTWLAMYVHGIGDNVVAARWALSAAAQGEPEAQSFLGSMYNRGWGVPMDPRAAQAWWLRAARAGVAAAIYNMGTTVAGGRGAPPDPLLGYALMRAAELRGFRFPPMNLDIPRARGQLDASQTETAESLAARYARDPASIPVP
ncbi:MAG: S8 family serine peptidase [Steroidobacteraceae bacterium]